MSTSQFDKALSSSMNSMNRLEVRSKGLIKWTCGKYQNAEITNLLTNQKYPKRSNISLIYQKKIETDKVLETARKLETAIPTSEWASKFVYHLENNEEEKP
jgi:hypothetical protein